MIYGLAGLAGAVVATVCLLIAYDVIARNLGLQPPASTVALTEYALLYFTMAAAPYLVRERGHIVVEILYRRLHPAAQRRVDIGILILCIVVSLTIALLASILMAEAIATGEIEVRSLDVPRWVLFAPLVGGFFLMAMEFIRLLLKNESVFASLSQQKETF